ncbi:hypothetical protein AaE_014223 [Aphanomyces astaci]|uniref:Uncharacterized protein n=1 Tax=Aphanomyces astaci TaxID=112090 RepID=A0A6A4ZFI7_APHAT|nr:hypothetical protein AaE_014223 [Aphanomyces astaci]
MWRDAGTLLQSLSMTDQAISCFLKQHDTLGVALELMDPTCTSVLTLVDIGTRGILNRQFEVVERVVHLLSAHKAQAFLLQVFVFYTQDQLSSDTPPTGWMLDDTSTLWSHLHDKANVVTLPLYLQTMLDQVAPKSDKVWARLIPYVQSLVGDVDDIEDAFAGGVIDTAFVKLMEANTVGYMVVKCLCQMSLDLVQGNFLAAFEAWSACLAQVAPLTSSNKGALLEVCALVFPTGVNSTPPPVGELVTDSACSRELWATFFLYQSVAFSRSLRAAADADDDNDHRRQEVQGALLFVIQWINQLLPAHVLQDMDESVVRVAQTALNDLSLLYHQLLDDNRPPLAEISAPST